MTMQSDVVMLQQLLLCMPVVSASYREMDWVMQRCRTYKQAQCESSVTADWVVQLDDLPKDCTILDITRFLNGSISFFVIWYKNAIKMSSISIEDQANSRFHGWASSIKNLMYSIPFHTCFYINVF